MTPYSEPQPDFTVLQYEFSLMGAIAIVSVLAIFIVYYVKNRRSNPKGKQ